MWWLTAILTQKPQKAMVQTFRQAVADSTDLQEKVKAGADLVALRALSSRRRNWKARGTGIWEGLTDFELDVEVVVTTTKDSLT